MGSDPRPLTPDQLQALTWEVGWGGGGGVRWPQGSAVGWGLKGGGVGPKARGWREGGLSPQPRLGGTRGSGGEERVLQELGGSSTPVKTPTPNS